MENFVDKTFRKGSGIYIIRNDENDNVYIGSAKNFSARFRVHLHHLRKGTHHAKRLQEHYDEFGGNSLRFEMLESVESVELLLNREQYYIDAFKPNFNNFIVSVNSPKGYKMSGESIARAVATKRANGSYQRMAQRLAEMNKGNTYRLGAKLSEESKAKIGQKSKGRFFSEESREKMRQNATGRLHSKEAKEKMSNSMKGNKNGLGKVFSESRKQKISEAKIKKEPIKQLTLDGELIKIWPTLYEAAISLNLNKGNINSCIHGKRKTVGGFKWEKETI